MRLQTKMLSLYAMRTLFIILALGVFLYFWLWEEKLNSIRVDLANNLQHLEFSLNLFFAEVQSDVAALARNKTVRQRDDRRFTSFLQAEEATFKYDIKEAEQQIIDIFNHYRTTHPYVNSVYMGRENGSFVRSHKRARPTRYDPRERPWYILAKSNPGKVMLTEAYPSVTTPDINIGVVAALTDERGIFYGVVGADITLVKISEYISHFPISPVGMVLLIDDKQTILAGAPQDTLFKKVHDYAPDLAKLLTANAQGFNRAEVRGEKTYVFLRNCQELDWKLAALIPARIIEAQIFRHIALPIFLTSLGLILLSSLTFFGLERHVVNPIKKFNEEIIKIYQTGNLDRRIDILSEDEIGLLAKSYNQMLSRLKETNDELVAHKEHLEDLVRERTARLAELNETLSKEIRERLAAHEELSVAKERAEAADRLKSAFLATMSHELRTPLNSIIGFTGIILQGIVGPLNDEQKKQLGMVRGSAQHLLSLINDVLDISKIEAGQLQVACEDFNLRQALDKTVGSTRPLAAKKGLELSCDFSLEHETIKGDRRRVEQVLLNLVGNAIKFTEKGSVRVTCEPHGEQVLIRVSDTGIGIKPEDMETIFQDFRQIDSGMTRKYEGTGLGLSICKRLVERMGGQIQVASVWGSGSTFSFTLPKERKGR